MKKEIKDLIDISQYFGVQKEYTLAGGGNTSYKNQKHIWVKASGATLATIDEEGFAVLDRSKVRIIRDKKYNSDEQIREVEVKTDLMAANIYPEKQKRPSVETSLHELIEYSFVVHMHPTMNNALMCSKNVKQKTLELFGEEAMFIEYSAGYTLFRKVIEALGPYREKFGKDPNIIFLENHGVFVSSNDTNEIKEIYHHITTTIVEASGGIREIEDLPVNGEITEFLPYMRMMLSEEKAKILKIRHNSLHQVFYKNKTSFAKASLPFTPDIIVYCKADYIYIDESKSPEAIIMSFQRQLAEFQKKNGYDPKIILIRDYGLVAVEDTAEAADIALDVYEDLLKISLYSESFGGPQFLSPEDISFIDNWEVENYRRQISKGSQNENIFNQKICIVTGAAQGFGEGLAKNLTMEGANVIIADLNEEKGEKTATDLAAFAAKNQVMYSKTDVSDPSSVKHLIIDTVANFGGIDLFISNAGILRAGSLDEMDPDTFRLMTKVNYEGFYLCAREASSVMKLQNKVKPGYFTDIIQVNSKSGLKGSNKNFAYAGAKFGGIGLTQSFAIELAPHKIKVNAICPGNFFEGPLWADEENGLFIQYLKAGKVPGAKTIEDVKAFYEEQVPIGRGCRVDDVFKAIKYAVDQKYETGQAIPVTGGQVMLN